MTNSSGEATAEPIYYTEPGTLVRRLLTQRDYDLLVERHVELKNKYELLASDVAMLANENSELVKKLDAYAKQADRRNM